MTAMTSKGSRLKAFARRWGWPRAICHLIMRGAGNYLGIHVFVDRTRFTTAETPNSCDLPDIEYRLIDSNTLIQASDDPSLELDREFVHAALERGDLGFGAFDKSRLVAYAWRSTSCAPDTDDSWVRVGRPYCYSYKSFTLTDYRGNRIVPALILYSDQEMLKLGYTHRVGIAAVTNFASRAIGAHMDSRVIGHAGYLKWFGRHFTYRSKAVAEIGFEFFEPRI